MTSAAITLRRVGQIEGLAYAREIAEGLRYGLTSKGSPGDHAQRRAATRIIQKIDDRIVELEIEGRTAVHLHFKGEADDPAA